MLNKIQVQLLKKGFHDNTSLRKAHGLRPRIVTMLDEKGNRVARTPNRRQRKEIFAAERAVAKRNTRGIVGPSKDDLLNQKRNDK